MGWVLPISRALPRIQIRQGVVALLVASANRADWPQRILAAGPDKELAALEMTCSRSRHRSERVGWFFAVSSEHVMSL